MNIAEILKQIVDVLNWIAINIPWEAVLASGALSTLLIGPQKLIKRWFEHNEQVIITFIGIVGPTLMFTYNYLIHHYPTDPQIVALQGLALSFATQPFYFVMVKPISKIFAARVAKAIAYNEEKRSALAPPPVEAPSNVYATSDIKPAKAVDIADFNK
jgi:hypothetical protein